MSKILFPVAFLFTLSYQHLMAQTIGIRPEIGMNVANMNVSYYDLLQKKEMSTKAILSPKVGLYQNPNRQQLFLHRTWIVLFAERF